MRAACWVASLPVGGLAGWPRGSGSVILSVHSVAQRVYIVAHVMAPQPLHPYSCGGGPASLLHPSRLSFVAVLSFLGNCLVYICI